jgi:hypothetical protein
VVVGCTIAIVVVVRFVMFAVRGGKFIERESIMGGDVIHTLLGMLGDYHIVGKKIGASIQPVSMSSENALQQSLSLPPV